MPAGSEPLVLDIWSHVDPRFGGVGPAAAALAEAAHVQSGWRFDQIAVCDKSESERSHNIPDSVRTIAARGPRPLIDAHLTRLLKNAISACDICHVHGIWMPHCLAVRKLALKLRKPIVSSAHGMLERWELANKKLKKQIYSHLFERPSLSHSACLRALSRQEAEDYRNFGLQNPMAIIPNGIDPLEPVDSSDLLSHHPELRDKQVVLFLSRIHRKKGILNLISAWPDVLKRNRTAHLLIAGGDCANTEEVARQMVAHYALANCVTFCGTLNGKLKLSALSHATAFCLPSYSEGMSMAVLEALSVGLPVIITKACNVDGVAESGSGYVISNDPETLSETVSECLSLPSSTRAAMSDSARQLARTRYNWSIIGTAMRSVYQWLLGGPKPACVIS